jgi:hypothetical protein
MVVLTQVNTMIADPVSPEDRTGPLSQRSAER